MWPLSIVLAVFLLDQLTKKLALIYLEPGRSVPVLRGIFHLTLVQNPGAAFGLLANQRIFFIVLTGLLFGAIFWWRRELVRQPVLFRLGLALQLGGALGNFLDRVRLGRVIDFLDFRVWPVFNLADTAIVIGVVLLAREIWRRSEKEEGNTAG